LKNERNIEFTNTSSRKNIVLDILKNTDNEANLKYINKVSLIPHTSFYKLKQLSTCSFNMMDKNKIDFSTNLFSKNETNITQNILKLVKSKLKSSEDVLEHKNLLKRKKKVTFSESINNINKSKKLKIKTNQLSKNLNQYLDLQQENMALLLNKKKNFNNFREKQMLQNSKNLKLPTIQQILIRKFPGPAGLLPDDIDKSEMINYEHKNNKSVSIDICSQNTKNLFCTGAWKQMMDDLPSDFQLFDIANVKEKAIELSKVFMKVPYLAGIIQYIDYKPNNPNIILKDPSGQINASFHHTICKIYPNALGINTVLLVKDVRLIVTSKNYVCIIISTKNLVSMYSDDIRLVKTSLLEQILDNNYNVKNFNLKTI
jgi:hypothetical protein